MDSAQEPACMVMLEMAHSPAMEPLGIRMAMPKAPTGSDGA
jgi:hypothetical protein